MRHLAVPFRGRILGLPFRIGAGGGAALGLKTNLVAWWELDEASGNRADSHTNALTLTDNNTVTSGTGVGGVGTAAEFLLANTEYLSRANNTLLEVADNDFTGCAWVYLTDKTANHAIWGMSDAAREQVLYYVSGSDRFTWLPEKPGGAGATTCAASTFGSPSANTWYFIVVQHNATANTVAISVNNGAFDSVAHTDGGLNQTNNVLFIGRGIVGAGQNYMTGRIAKVAWWRSAAGGGGLLTAAQITALYNSGAGLTYAQL